MSGNGARRGKRIAMASALAGVAVLAAAAVALRDVVREEWYLRELRSEPKSRQVATLNELAALGSGRGLREALLLLDDAQITSLLGEHPGALPAIAASLRDSSADVRLRAANALRRAAAPESVKLVPALIEALHDESPLVRGAVAEAFATIGPAAGSAVPSLVASLRWAAVEKSKDGAAWKSTFPFSKALGKIGSASIPALLELARGAGDPVRELALSSFEHMDPSAGPFVISHLQAMEESIREIAAEAFCRMPPCPTAAPALLHALGDGSPAVRGSALRAMRKIAAADEGIVATILERIDREDARVRAAAVECLQGSFAASSALPLFAKLAGDEDKNVRLRAVRSLGLCGAEPGPVLEHLRKSLLGEKDRRVRQETVKAIVRLGSLSVPALTEAIESSDTETRRQAAVGLGQLGLEAESAIPSLLKLLRDPDEDMRFQAMQVLGGLGPVAKEAAPILAELVRTAPTPAARMRAESALKRVSDEAGEAK